MLSFQDNWLFHTNHLVSLSPNAKRGRVLRVLKELEHFGYITQERVRGEDGSFISMERIVHETSSLGYEDQDFWFEKESTTVAKPTSGLSTSGLSTSGKDDCIIKNNINEEEIEPKKNNTSSAENEFSLEFQEIWSHYPRRLNKKDALSCYSARRKEGVSFEELLTATINYAKVREGEEPSYTMHPKTFFGTAKRYEDYADNADGMVLPMSNVERAIAGFQARQNYIEGEVL